MRATTLEEAMKFFMENSSGSITCLNDKGQSRVCNCYPEAKEFFGN